jgi:hypothetical protein
MDPLGSESTGEERKGRTMQQSWGDMTDDAFLTLLLDAALGGIEENDGGAELKRLAGLYPHLRVQLYTEVIAQGDIVRRLEWLR